MSVEEQQKRIANKDLECQIFILQNPPVYTNSECFSIHKHSFLSPQLEAFVIVITVIILTLATSLGLKKNMLC